MPAPDSSVTRPWIEDWVCWAEATDAMKASSTIATTAGMRRRISVVLLAGLLPDCAEQEPSALLRKKAGTHPLDYAQGETEGINCA
jgi:hypothetical protein